ncbi:tRNA ligase [Annulohypoxylon truncatum]|uniref:tRNA ligase n=1 Tax=Annulohypoxylon truncatum TaxID=327061 RepID=UPI002007E93B|nr:tRNA ligase [Annulohypoxylon truncatum]KAI1205219.1 tRNA ligase [Annulohypoxylon truncatum]
MSPSCHRVYRASCTINRQLILPLTRLPRTSPLHLRHHTLQRSLTGPQQRVQFRAIRQVKSSSILQRQSYATMESGIPYREQDPQEVANLVRDLGNKTVKTRKTTYEVKGSDGITVDSWRYNDWDYKKRNLPTYARGLFTTRNRNGHHEIVVRGYDKFFNTGEVRETEWANILTNTKGPYELTLKENGCIIFISGLEDETLLVCSKHATGDRSDVEISHASAGERWVDKQLATLGKTRQDFARELRRRNVTAVAELCDDSFEEHILAYGPEKAGLYLHGINVNVPEFMTYSSSRVQQFADEWGFRKVGLQTYDNVNDVKTFLESVAETGAHEGRDVEGFVVRCKMSTNPGQEPYNDWFFKYKFEEPYLLYRQWRECTKALIAGKPPKFKKHVKITEEYLSYARKRLSGDSNLGKEYNKNHGIIALRDDFLAYKHMKGSDAANIENEFGNNESGSVSRDIVLVPIATIGCGKTTVGIALTHLFGWGIVQNDNIQGKQRPAQMVKAVKMLLPEHPVVIADRNNSERRERAQIIKDIQFQNKDARLVALNFAHGDIDETRRITRERVLKRGDNHQTIQAASDEAKVIGIMENFIQRFQPCDPESDPDNGFDLVIDLDPTQDSRANVETVVRELHRKYPALITKFPSDEEMDEAVKAAIENYKPDLRHNIPDRNKGRDKKQNQQAKNQEPQAPKKKALEYMSISVPAKDINVALEAAFKGTDPQTQRFYKQLQQTRRIQPLFHVTLMHRASAKEHPELWQRYTALEVESQSQDGKISECDVQLERVVYDNRIMAVVVRILDEEQKWTCVNKVPHITIGTRDDSVKPKESNDLLAKWLQDGSGGDTGIGERLIEGQTVVKGSVRGVLSR